LRWAAKCGLLAVLPISFRLHLQLRRLHRAVHFDCNFIRNDGVWGRSSIIALSFAEKKRRRKVRKFWVHPVLQNRTQDGHFSNLFSELRQYEDRFHNYFRMSISSFDTLANILKNKIQRQDKQLRRSIPPEECLAVITYHTCNLKFDNKNTYLLDFSPWYFFL
jgi:hypothetical protein